MGIIGIGNPEKFNDDQINKHTKMTYEEIHKHDTRRINAIKHITGINIKIIWENDYRNDYKKNNLTNDLIKWIYSKDK